MVRRYDASHANNWAQVIAWNALFAFVPIVIAVVAVFSFLLSRADFTAQVASAVAGIAPTRQERIDIARTIDGLAQHRNLLAGVAVVGLLWSGSSLFAAMDNSLSAIYGVPARSFLVKRLRGMVLVIVLSALLVPLLLSSALLSVGGHFSQLPAGMPAAARVLLQVLAGTVGATVLFLLSTGCCPTAVTRYGASCPAR